MRFSGRLFLLAVALAMQAAAEGGATRWLAVAGSADNLPSVLKIAQDVRTSWPRVQIVASSDCSNLRSRLYLVVVEMSDDRDSATSTVRKLKSKIPDAYPRECRVKPQSRLALGVPLVDPSIEKVPRDVVNWTEQDRLSQVIPVSNQGYLWVRRTYVAPSYDPREGRRVSVLFFSRNPSDARLLEADCTDFSHAALQSRIAIACARETAADTFFHTVDVFDASSGRKISSTSRCRKPVFISNTELVCEEEHVGPDGRLTLRRKRVQV